MQVSIFKRQMPSGAKYWYLQWRHPVTGQVKTQSVAPVEDLTKKEAELIRLDKRRELLKAKYPILEEEPDYVRLSELREEFISYIVGKGRAATTVNEYKNAMKHLIEAIGDVYIQSIDFSVFTKWREKRQKGKVKNITINKEHRHLKAIFNYAYKKRKYIDNNPFADEDPIETGKKVKPVIPEKHIKKFFKVINDPKDKAFFKMLYYFGCRPSEAWKLQWSDIYTDEEIPYLIFRDRKGNDEAELPIPTDLLNDLKKLDKTSERVFDQIKFGQKWRPNEIMKEYLEKADLPLKYSPKWFRHTFASRLSEDSMGVKAVLGHSTIRVTEGYTHSDLKRKQSVINRLPKIGD